MDSLTGKKVFFFNPHSVIKEELVDAILGAEYEVYFVKDHRRGYDLLAKFPDSIVFVNIDDGMPEKDWENYIRKVLSSPATQDVRVGIVSYNNDPQIMQKYLMDIGIQCGFIQLKLGLAQSTKIILQALEANEARGRRKYVRVKCDESINTGFNVKVSNKLFDGTILDISSVGMAGRFNVNPQLRPKTVLKDLQLKLKGVLVNCEVVNIGQREDDSHVYVFIFKFADERPRAQIRKFINHSLQEYIEKVRT